MSEKEFLCFNDNSVDFWTEENFPRRSVRARKLFIGHIVETKHQSVEGLSSLFGEFGEIEKIEIFPEKFPSDRHPDERYAYVTFADSSDAARAYKKHGSDGYTTRTHGLKVLPADTWKQPDLPIEHHQMDECVLQELNDDCLLHIFRFCDLDTLRKLCNVSERFAALIRRRTYPTRKEISFGTNVLSFRENMQNIGSYLSGATIWVRKNQLGGKLAVDIFSKFVGTNIEKLQLYRVNPSERFQKQFKAIFPQLKELDWELSEYQRYQIHLAQLCPRLEKLNIKYFLGAAKQNTQTLDIGVEPWPSLKKVHLMRAIFQVFLSRSIPRPETPFYDGRFIRNNPQLTEVTMDRWGHIMDDLITDASQHLADLEVLNMCYEGAFFRSKTILRSLNSLRELKTVSLRNWGTEANLLTILEIFSHLQPNSTNLELSIYLVYAEEEDERDMADKPPLIRLPHLQHFTLYGYKLTMEGLMEIIEAAPALRVLDLDCEEIAIQIDESLLQEVVNIRKHQAHLSDTPIVRLKLIFQKSRDGICNKKFKMAKRIRTKMNKLRRATRVVLPFYEDDDQPPYSEEIARAISIEMNFDSEYTLLK